MRFLIDEGRSDLQRTIPTAMAVCTVVANSVKQFKAEVYADLRNKPQLFGHGKACFYVRDLLMGSDELPAWCTFDDLMNGGKKMNVWYPEEYYPQVGLLDTNASSMLPRNLNVHQHHILHQLTLHCEYAYRL
jgi:hypothetical protein